MKKIARKAAQLNQLADKYADEPPMSDAELKEFELTLPDDIWLAGVVSLLADRISDLEAAGEIVERNRVHCLKARHELGIQPWEMAQYAAQKEGL